MDEMTGTTPSLVCRPHFALLFAFTLAGLAGACGSRPAAPPTASADAWAVVNGREIRRDDVEKAYRRSVQGSAVPSEDEALAAKLTLLNELIVQDLLLAKAQELKIELTDAELDTAYAEGRKGIPEEAFQQQLTQRNLTAADMREALRRDMIVEKVIEREVQSKITVSDQDISEFFNANRAQFNRAEEAYRIAQIVVTPARDPEVANRTGDDATTPQEAADKAQMLMERLKSGTSFGELAADFSEDPQTAPRGGDLGFVPVSAIRQAPPTLRSRREQLLRTAYLSALRNDAVVVNHLARRLVESQGKMPSLAPTPPGTP
jgi:peptidyl-prolyl cis-trans isomerase SurA